jgi:hypothetical protein
MHTAAELHKAETRTTIDTRSGVTVRRGKVEVNVNFAPMNDTQSAKSLEL